MSGRIAITIIHRLQHRVRLRLTPAAPQMVAQVQREMNACAGLRSFSYDPRSQNILIYFDPQQTSLEQLLLHMTVSLAPQSGLRPIHLLEYSCQADLKTVFLSLFFIASCRMSYELSGGNQIMRRIFQLSQWSMLPAALHAFSGGKLEESDLWVKLVGGPCELEVCRIFDLKKRLMRLFFIVS
ncbi:MAG: hypothetical protein HRT88_21880 [Lentisphaeraceae bacterium]|nr:hypothetical protein [Lentisphaeraceae bacterium]